MAFGRRLYAWIPAACVAAGLLLIYISILGKNISWSPYAGDGGDFLAAALTWGIPHPSGYPTYIILLRFFLALPFNSEYWRAALLSAAAAASGAGLLCRWIETEVLPGQRWAWLSGMTAAAAWGSAPLVWLHAIIVEVYALQAFFITIFLWWFVLLVRRGSRLLLAVLSLIMGLSLGTHLTMLLLLPPALVGGIMARTQGTSLRRLALFAGLGLLGSMVYVYLPLAARSFPPINWGNPQNLQGVWWEISAEPYQSLVFRTPPGLILERIPAWARLLFEQFSLPGLILGVVGGLSSVKPAALRWLLAWIFAAYTGFAILYKANDSMVYLIPAFLAWAVWVAQGLSQALSWNISLSLPKSSAKVSLGGWVGIGFVLFLLARMPFTARQVSLSGDTRAEEFVNAFMQAAPPGALVASTTDFDTFPLWYAHFGLKQRPDLYLFAIPLVQYEWYRETMAHVYPDLQIPMQFNNNQDWLQSLIAKNPQRAFCQTEYDPTQKNARYTCKE